VAGRREVAYVANFDAGGEHGLSVFVRDAAFRFVERQVVNDGLWRPLCLRLSPNGRFLFSGDCGADGEGSVASYAIDLVLAVIARDFGHLAHGYVVTSHASQGKTVDKVFIGQSQQSLPASSR
jgi:6-phosphogluconolactonase (cycloisomerase 2 family)